MSQSECYAGGVPVSPDVGVSVIRSQVCATKGVSGRSAGSSSDGLAGPGTRGPDFPDDARSVPPKEGVPAEDGVQDDEDADEEAQVRLRQVQAGQGAPVHPEVLEGVVPDEEGGDRIRQRNVARPPSKREVKERNVVHMPFRSWRPICMAGRGIATIHRSAKQKELREVAMVVFDYCFLKNRPGDPTAVVLVGRDCNTGMYLNHVVPRKGADIDWIADRVKKDLYRMGHYGRLIIKSDGEPAIVALLEEVARRRAGAVTVLGKVAERGQSV